MRARCSAVCAAHGLRKPPDMLRTEPDWRAVLRGGRLWPQHQRVQQPGEHDGGGHAGVLRCGPPRLPASTRAVRAPARCPGAPQAGLLSLDVHASRQRQGILHSWARAAAAARLPLPACARQRRNAGRGASSADWNSAGAAQRRSCWRAATRARATTASWRTVRARMSSFVAVVDVCELPAKGPSKMHARCIALRKAHQCVHRARLHCCECGVIASRLVPLPGFLGAAKWRHPFDSPLADVDAASQCGAAG